jgi:hypothetical protein
LLQTNVAYAACRTPGGESGHCRHLKYCVLHLFTNSREQFLEYFCRIDRSVLHKVDTLNRDSNLHCTVNSR